MLNNFISKSKEMEAFHVVLTTHNSRISARMKKYKILPENPFELDTSDEIHLTNIIADIVKEKGYRIIAFNICKDHVHLIIVCEYLELDDIVKVIKGKSAFLFNKSEREINDIHSKGFQPLANHDEKPSKAFQPLENNNPNHDPDKHKGHLWSQKYFRANLDVWTLAAISPKAGYLYKDSYLDNAIVYIQNNRQKHQLQEIEQLSKIIGEMIIPIDDSFRQE